MRIGLVTGEYPPMEGGVGAYSATLAKEFQRSGHSVSVLSGISAQKVNDIPVFPLIKRWGLNSLGVIREWAVNQNVDIISLQFQTAAFRMSPWIHFLPESTGSIPLVTTFHDLRYPYLFPKAGRLREWIVRRLAHHSNGVIVTNQEDQRQLKAISKVTLIPIGSNILKTLPKDFDPHRVRRQIGAQDNDFVLAYFGLINRSKGLDVLLRALSNLREKNVPVHLVMIGGAGTSDPTNITYQHEIRQLIEKLHLQSAIHQTGFVDEETVGAYLSASDAIVLPFVDGASYRRGSLMAAIHYRRPVVTTIPTVSIPDFKDKVNMLLVNPGDVNALESAIQRLIESGPLRQQLCAGTETLAALFNWQHIASKTINYFQWVIEECD